MLDAIIFLPDNMLDAIIFLSDNMLDAISSLQVWRYFRVNVK